MLSPASALGFGSGEDYGWHVVLISLVATDVRTSVSGVSECLCLWFTARLFSCVFERNRRAFDAEVMDVHQLAVRPPAGIYTGGGRTRNSLSGIRIRVKLDVRTVSVFSEWELLGIGGAEHVPLAILAHQCRLILCHVPGIGQRVADVLHTEGTGRVDLQ